ncbi:hypothetical protein CDAR_238151 [Caerostris darwini]|uniref:Chitin-binding type-2 domain-containing protein n=1 Tax=Caerostris darwini TaxID=1538125 RepID=A0AAV4TLF9_9ARAC|nr:hypothetical protein CDAR_238151 [Caerostris darwini]
MLHQNNLQRGGKPINWIWNTDYTKSPDTQRRRRYLIDESSDPWWNNMKTIWDPTDGVATTVNPLSPEEDIYFSGKVNHPIPYENPESYSPPENKTVEAAIMVDVPHTDDIDSSLLRELIIEEHHRPSKIELESASQRLKDISEKNTVAPEIPTTENVSNSEPLSTVDTEAPSVLEQEEKPMSYVEYIVPGVEHVESHVEYVNDQDRFRESEKISHTPFVEYIVPTVEYIEPEIEYFTTTRMSNISKQIKSFALDDSFEEKIFGSRNLPLEEVFTIDQNRFLAVHNEEKMTSETKSSAGQRVVKQNSKSYRRVHRRNPRWGIPEIDYPTLEILPVIHFPCEEYASPGYYADVSSRCQMFHICHDNGQRSSFLCPIGTVFNQEYLVCDWWYNVDCGSSLDSHIEDSYEAFGSSNEGITVTSIENQNIDNFSINKNNENSSKKFSLFSAVKDKPEPDSKLNFKRKLTSTKHPNLSQKAINYPVGYAILLREFMKNSQRNLSDQSKKSGLIQEQNNNSYSNSNNNSYSNSPKRLSRKEKTTQITDKYSKDIRNPDREIESLPNNREYHGGSKPFVSSEKRIHESVRTKSIKIRYFPPKPQDASTFNNSITRQPQINTTHYGSAQEYVPQYTSEDNFERFSSTEYPSLKNSKEVEPIRNKTRVILNKPSINHRDYYNLKNISDDFEIIHFPLNNNKSKNEFNKKYDNHNYSSSASAVHYKKEIYDDYEDLISAFDDLYHLGNETQKGEKTRQDNVTVIPQIRHKVNGNLFHKNRKPVSNKNLYTTIYSESTTLKKSKVVEPKISLTKLNKRYGERLNTQVTTTKNERVILFHTTPALEDLKIPNRIGFLKTKQFRIPKHEVTTQLAPVYIHTEVSIDSTDKSDNKSLQNDSVTNPEDIETNKTLSEFDITSKFVNRISNLVSETKAHSDDTQQNLSSTLNLINKDVPYTVSVRVSSKYVLPSNRSSSIKSLQNSTDAMRTLQPWIIKGSSSPKLDNFVTSDKINRNMSLWNALLNSNSTKVNNSHGGFIVVKKVRLKRDTTTPMFHPFSKFVKYLKSMFKYISVQSVSTKR